MAHVLQNFIVGTMLLTATVLPKIVLPSRKMPNMERSKQKRLAEALRLLQLRRQEATNSVGGRKSMYQIQATAAMEQAIK